MELEDALREVVRDLRELNEGLRRELRDAPRTCRASEHLEHSLARLSLLLTARRLWGRGEG